MIKPRPRLSAFVSACRRVRVSGKRNRADRPREEKECAERNRRNAKDIERCAHSSLSGSLPAVGREASH